MYLDAKETRSPAERAADLAARLPLAIAAAMRAPAHAARLAGIDHAAIVSPAALAALPVLRKSDLPALHAAAPPFGDLVPTAPGRFARLFASPGPIHEAELPVSDSWRMASALHAAGFRYGDVVLNTFSYHLTPGGWIMDAGLRALGCAVIPAGPGQTAPVTLARGMDFARLLGPTGRLATGDPAHVPVGIYAQAALTWLGVWDAVNPRLARAESVRAALLLVERGEAPFGIVYATDAAISPDLKVVATFPPESHPPIAYPFALTRRAADNAAAKALLAFLTGAEAVPTWRRFGFRLNE